MDREIVKASGYADAISKARFKLRDKVIVGGINVVKAYNEGEFFVTYDVEEIPNEHIGKETSQETQKEENQTD